MRYLPDQSGIDETPSLEGTVLLFALCVGAEAVGLTLRALADSTSGVEASQALE